MLVLPIKKKWFDMIISGEKKEEYREIKPYYDARFKKYSPRTTAFRLGIAATNQFYIVFRNGYGYKSPSIKCLCELAIGEGKKEWGAVPGKKYYVLKIKRVTKNDRIL